MTIHEKLGRLLETANASAVSRKAGIHPGTLSSILNGKNRPMAGTALNLARALEVDLYWLLDDKLGWPPRRIESGERTALEPIAALSNGV
jgi:transcriptional regulator with XRE-family HTH domain